MARHDNTKRGFYRKDITIEMVLEACLDGLTADQTATRFSCSVSLVRSRLRAAGQQPKLRRRTDLVVEPSGAGQKEHVPTERLQEVLAEGRAVGDIARQFGLTTTSIRNRMHQAAERHTPDDLEEWRKNPHSSDVIGAGHILCLDCGERVLRNLSLHLRKHGTSAAEYRARWGYDPSQPLRSKASTAVIESKRRSFCERTEPHSNSLLDKPMVERIMQQVRLHWPGADVFQPAMEHLAREASRERSGFVLAAEWQRRTAANGQIELGTRLMSTGFPSGILVHVSLSDGQLYLRAAAAETTIQVPRKGLHIQQVRMRNMLAVIRARIWSSGHVRLHELHYVGSRYAGRTVYIFLFPGVPQPLVVGEDGCTLTATRAASAKSHDVL